MRGQVPSELNHDIAYRIGRAYAQFLSAKQVIVGHDIRLTSPELSAALVDGLTDGGVDVLHIGQCGTEEVYFATFHLNTCGGICITASHNPKEFNGMKFVQAQAKPISGDSGLKDIQRLVEENNFPTVLKANKGQVTNISIAQAYTEHLLTYIDSTKLKPMKVVTNAGNGGAGEIIDRLTEHLPFEFIKLNHSADGNFPNGVPNPLLPENRTDTVAAIKNHQADFGIAWDGDFDRCFFFDENGEFVEGYYIVGLLATMLLAQHPNEKIVHDPRLFWNTQDIVAEHGGSCVQSKTGHAFIKECMRKEDAIYGGEMSAHHYFKDFAYCDNGNIPWLLISSLMSQTGKTLSSLIAERKACYPCSGEINTKVADPVSLIAAIEQQYCSTATSVDHTDGLSISFENWRFNLRMSNTEPLLRLNVESKNDVILMQEKTAELLATISA